MKLLQLLRHFAPLLFALLALLAPARAQTTNFFEFSVLQDKVHFTFPTNAASYYVLNGSLDLKTFFPLAIVYGSNGPQFRIPATNSEAFFFAKDISIYSPEDSLGDGIDDIFKLESGLNPLDPTLAGSPSGMLDANGHPLTWLQYYRQSLSRNIAIGEGYSRETSVFNFGLPTATFEAFSRELSLYNGQSPPLVVVPQEAYGREVSIFNFGVPTAPLEAISREVSLYNGQSPPLVVIPQEVYGREVSVFNTGEILTNINIASREVTVFNFGRPTAPNEAISREVSVFNHTL